MFPTVFKVVICAAVLSWGPVTSEMLQGEILRSVWFNRSLMIWRVGQSIQMMQSWDKCLIHPGYLCRLEKWANRNVMKFEKRRCESSTWRRTIKFTMGLTGWKADLQRRTWGSW